MSLAVITRTGALVHWPDVSASRHAQTICGREWINLHTPNVSASAVTCRLCRAALEGENHR